MERKITIEAEGIYKEEYQMRMLQDNSISGLLKVQGQGVNGKTCYDYEVSGKVSMRAMYEKSNIKAEDLKQFLYQFAAVLKETKKYLLDNERILVDADDIFYDNGTFYFCYYPPGGRNLWEDFRKLADYFVMQTDYKDQECVQMVFALHKGVMEENFSLEKVLAECMMAAKQITYEEWKKQQEDERKKADIKPEQEEEAYTYDTKEHDWITEQEATGAIMRETDNMWTPVKRFLNRHKEAKWGDWDGLYIEEEEL